MAQRRRKRRISGTGGTTNTRGRHPWGTVITAVIIIAVAAAYVLFRYAAVRRTPQRARDAYHPPRSSTLRLYFANEQGERLVAEGRRVTAAPSLEANVEQAVRELLRGPAGSLSSTIPPSVELKGVRMEGDGIVWIDFSEALVSAHPGGSTAEILTVYSIVNTVALNFSEVKRVGILVEGKRIDTLAGHLDCREPFAADTTIIQ